MYAVLSIWNNLLLLMDNLFKRITINNTIQNKRFICVFVDRLFFMRSFLKFPTCFLLSNLNVESASRIVTVENES